MGVKIKPWLAKTVLEIDFASIEDEIICTYLLWKYMFFFSTMEITMPEVKIYIILHALDLQQQFWTARGRD